MIRKKQILITCLVALAIVVSGCEKAAGTEQPAVYVHDRDSISWAEDINNTDGKKDTEIILTEENYESKEKTDTGDNEGETNMVMKIDQTVVDVSWEDNAAVQELKDLAASGINIEMSMYGGFEQVGSIGKRLTQNDKQITTQAGDIVLYSGDQLVVFYGSNSWSYTRLGKINCSQKELTELLGNGDVTITLNTEVEQ